jgi:hypothetical protein
MSRWAVGSAILVLAGAGCGGSGGNSGASGASGTGASATGGQGASGAATGGSGGASITTTLIDGTVRLGTFIFSERPALGSGIQTSVGAEFRDGPPEWAGCTRHDLGPCYWIECPAVAAYIPSITVDAGTMSYQTSLGQSGTFAPDVVNFYTAPGGSLLWNSTSDFIDATATGGAQIPAFNIRVTPPSALTLTSPTIPSTGDLVVNTSSDLQLTWSGGGAGTAVFYLRYPQSLVPALSCEFRAADGAGTVPQIGLAALDPNTDYVFYLYSRNRTEQTAGDWTIWASALEYPTNDFYLSLSVLLQP